MPQGAGVLKEGPAVIMTRIRAVFLDRDGTLNHDVGYPAHWSQVHVYPFAFEAVRSLRAAGLVPVVITNQSGVGRGFFGEPDLAALHREYGAAFAGQGAAIDGFFYCPHYNPPGGGEAGCACAKPKPALGLRAAAELGLELRGSYMVGDKTSDILFGLALGAVPVLVQTGYGRASLRELERRGLRPECVAPDVAAAAHWILARERQACGPPRPSGRKEGARS